MNSLKIVFLLAVVALAKASQWQEQSNSTDEELARAFIECARKAILTGMPDIDIPSHNPLIIPRNLSRNWELGDIRASIALYNLMMTDIPIWEVRQFDLLDSNDGVDIFNYTIYWPKIVFELQWQFSAQLGNIISTEKEGRMSLELDHVNFAGLLNFTKPDSGRNETINELVLDITALNVQLNITNLGDLGEYINEQGGHLIAYFMEHNPAKHLIGPLLRLKLNRDWMNKPERLDTMIANCKK